MACVKVPRFGTIWTIAMIWAANVSNGDEYSVTPLESDETRRGFESRLEVANVLYLRNLKPQATSALREASPA
jgi:hypothetical protein